MGNSADLNMRCSPESYRGYSGVDSQLLPQKDTIPHSPYESRHTPFQKGQGNDYLEVKTVSVDKRGEMMRNYFKSGGLRLLDHTAESNSTENSVTSPQEEGLAAIRAANIFSEQ